MNSTSTNDDCNRLSAFKSGNIFTVSMPFLVALVAAPGIYFVFNYWASIKKHVRDLEERFSKYKVIREKSKRNDRQIRCLELHPDFVKEVKDQFNVMSLGQYLSQLKPGSADTAKFLKKELQLTISNLLLDNLGRTYGAALLPILGMGSIDSGLSDLAAKMASWAANQILTDSSEIDATEDIMAFQMSLQELIAFLNINQKHNPSSSEDAISLFLKGEVGHGELSYHSNKRYGEKGFHSPFVMEKDFKTTIANMEKLSKEKDSSWDPDDDSYSDPKPINERILPDLYLGWGNAKCTHTKIQCLENRLLGFLLTRLSSNFHKRANGKDELFVVHWHDIVCHYPDELIQAFIDNGHTVEVCPRATIANFGMALCVKEEDGSFVNVPTCIQLRTGVERDSDNKAAYFQAPHGGLDVEISGPLVGTERSCDVQFYVSAEGLTGFYANHDVAVPWLKRSSLAEIYSNDTAVRAVRMAGLVGTVFNSIGTDMNLPCGGYGVLGMCNDSATLIDFALRKETSAYPLLSTGRYLNHIVSYFLKLQEDLRSFPDMTKVVEDIESLIKSTSDLPSDLHIAPSTLVSTAERFIATYPKCTFQLTEDSKEVMREMADKFKRFAK